jgi:hypothetical protein
MISNADKIKESEQMLDSLIMQIKDSASTVTELTFPDAPDKQKYISAKFKRSGKKYKFPTPESQELINNICCQYADAAFTDNEDLIKFIKAKLNLSAREDWFIDLKKIVEELSIINSSNKFKIDSYAALQNIRDYVAIKIWAIICAKYVEEVNTVSIIVKPYKTYLKTLKNRVINNKLSNTELDVEFLKNIDIFKNYAAELGSNKEPIEFIEGFFKGKSEYIFIPKIYNEFITSDKQFNKGEKLLLVFNLFALFIKDRVFHTKEVFTEINKSFRNYDAYKKKAVQNILDLK